jgi:hypothetical protein
LLAKFDNNESVLDYFDLDVSIKRINVDLPIWVLNALDSEADRRGITRQSLIKHWLVDKIDSVKSDFSK